MTTPQGGLGRGLSALIPQKIAPAPETIAGKTANASVQTVDPQAIVPNPHQPRKNFVSADLEDLLSSIKEHGIIQPLVVTDLGDGTYELIAGERRLRASKMLGLKEVPVVVRTATEQQKLELALIENIQRSNLDAVEEAQAYQSLVDLFSLRHEDVAKRVGKSRSYVTNALRLLELDEDILEALANGKISRSHARTLLAETDELKRSELFYEMLNGTMTVRQAEVRAGNKARQKQAEKNPQIAALESELREALGTKVQINMNGSSGKITIHFYSKEEMKALIEHLTK
ncbi:ParB/RepB/Spo0J family partition protein [Patescibacteria group bacterium]|nr:ParB/RepB/Spo0J family partition protein [Patescibacteria group bacterium]